MIDANQAESTSDNTSAIIDGVVAVAVVVVLIIATSLTIVMLRNRSGNYSAKTRQDHKLLH